MVENSYHIHRKIKKEEEQLRVELYLCLGAVRWSIIFWVDQTASVDPSGFPM
jgi:hypothetical protein